MQVVIQTFKLLLPAIIPSWRFFDFIAPSPRIQYAVLPTREAEAKSWQEFRPRPQSLSFHKMLGRMLWNPAWNESLFLVSCAERLIDNPSQHSENEILQRISRQLSQDAQHNKVTLPPYLQFRLVFIKRNDQGLEQNILFHSRIEPLTVQEKYGTSHDSR